MSYIHKITKRLSLLVLSLAAAGCACVDPLEPVNREMFKFNMVLDRALFRPVACVYNKVVPAKVACSIGNFFDNIDDLTNIANNVLQFKFYDAWSDCWRFAFNTTFGIGGLFDVATCAGLPKHHQDFGLTLARYGFVDSTYLMLPFFGPSTIRDTVGWTVDWNYLSIWPYINPKSLRYGLYGLRLVHKRACLLDVDELIDKAIDPYLFVRDAYLQKRACDIRSICPPDLNGATAVTTNGASPGDTFVADEEGASSGDTFVADEEVVVTTEKNAPKASAPKAGADPFEAP